MKKQNTAYGVIGIILGIIGGIAGTAFAMGADKQKVHDTLITHTAKIKDLKADTQQQLDRFSEIIASQMTQLQGSILDLTNTVGNLRTDVSVLKALMERMERDLRERSDSD